MASSESYFSTAVGLLRKTMPFLALNAMIYGAFAVATAVWIAIWIGLILLVAKASGAMAFVFLVIAFGLPSGLMWWGKRWLLYMVKGAHIAVLTKALFQHPLPEGKGQIEFGRDMVKAQFTDLNLLFALDVLIHGVLRFATNMVLSVARWLPGGAQQAARAIMEIIQQSLTYVDEAILSYSVARNEPNVWNSARHGIILYAQSYKSILWTAVKIWMLSRVFWIASFLIVGGPFLLIAMAKGGVNTITDWMLVLMAVFMASMVEKAVFEPFAMTYTLVTFHRTIAGQTPNAEWDAKLMAGSAKFRELAEKAKNFVAPAGAAAAAVAAAPTMLPPGGGAPSAPAAAWAPPAYNAPPGAVPGTPHAAPAPAWAPPAAAPPAAAAPAWAPPAAAPPAAAAPAWAPPAAAPPAAPAPAWAPPTEIPPAHAPAAGQAPELSWGQPAAPSPAAPPAAAPEAAPPAAPPAGAPPAGAPPANDGRTVMGWNVGELFLPGGKPPGSGTP